MEHGCDSTWRETHGSTLTYLFFQLDNINVDENVDSAHVFIVKDFMKHSQLELSNTHLCSIDSMQKKAQNYPLEGSLSANPAATIHFAYVGE